MKVYALMAAQVLALSKETKGESKDGVKLSYGFHQIKLLDCSDVPDNLYTTFNLDQGYKTTVHIYAQSQVIWCLSFQLSQVTLKGVPIKVKHLRKGVLTTEHCGTWVRHRGKPGRLRKKAVLRGTVSNNDQLIQLKLPDGSVWHYQGALNI